MCNICLLRICALRLSEVPIAGAPQIPGPPGVLPLEDWGGNFSFVVPQCTVQSWHGAGNLDNILGMMNVQLKKLLMSADAQFGEMSFSLQISCYSINQH